MKNIIKKCVATLILIIIFLTQTSIITVAEFINDQIVNYGVIIKLTSEQERVKTGETQKVTIRSSYANPNDEDYKKVRIYLWDYADDFLKEYKKENYEKNVNRSVEILNLENNKMIFPLLDNRDLTVVVSLVEKEKERYLEFEMPPGTSCDMEMEFKVPNGITDDLGLILEPTIVTEDGKTETNNYLDEPKCIFWESEFSWENLQKHVNYEKVNLNQDNSIGKDLIYTFSADSLNTKGSGDIWTKNVIFKDVINIPDTISLENLTVEKDENEKYTGKIIDANNNEIFKLNINEKYQYSIINLEVKSEGIICQAVIENPNINEEGELTNEFNPLSDITINLNASKLKVSDQFISDGTGKIHNSVNCVFVPCITDEKVTLESLADTVFDEDIVDYDISKSADKNSAVYGDAVNYDVEITNNGRKSITKQFFDVLPEGMYFNDEQTRELKAQGFEVGHVGRIYSDNTERGKEVSFSKDNYWDSKNGLEVNYPVNKDVSLHEGVRLVFDVYVPKENNVNGKLIAYTALQMGNNNDDYSGLVDTNTIINFDNATEKEDKKLITVSIIVPTDCTQYSRLQNISIRLFGNGTDYSGLIYVNNVKLYDGVVEVNNSEIVAYQNSEDEIKSKNVSFFSSDNWDSEQFSWEASLNGMKNELDEKAIVTFDLITEDKVVSGKIIPVVVLQTQADSSGCIQAQKILNNDDFKRVDGKKVANVSLLMPTNVAEQEILQKLIINIVGSGSYYSGNIAIGNVKLYTVNDISNNYIKKDITVQGFSSETVSYQATVGTVEKTTAINNALFGDNSSFKQADATIEIQNRETDGIPEDKKVSLKKRTEARAIDNGYNGYICTDEDSDYSNSYSEYQESLNVLGPRDVIYYTVELKNDNTEDQTLDLEDYSPLAGNYNYINGTYKKYLNMSNPRGFSLSSENYLKIYGLDSVNDISVRTSKII